MLKKPRFGKALDMTNWRKISKMSNHAGLVRQTLKNQLHDRLTISAPSTEQSGLNKEQTMAQLLVVILYEPDQLPKLLDGWQQIGLSGVTILDSAGGYRARNWLQKAGLGAIGDLFRVNETQSRTLLSVIDDDSLLEQAIAVTEMVVGDLYQPQTGILFVVPVTQMRGLLHPSIEPTAAPTPAAPAANVITDAELITRSTPVAKVDEILRLEPVIVNQSQPLLEVAEALAQNPIVNVACVVDDQARLVGILPLPNLADDLFILVVPEEFLSEALDLQEALNFAKMSRTQTAGDAMLAPVSVTQNDHVRVAFRKLHDHKLTGIPIVDEQNKVTGYITLLEMLVLYIRSQKNTTSQGE
jgi:CBS domain-containing protein